MNLKSIAAVIGVLCALYAASSAQTAPQPVPNPVLYLTGQESYTDDEGRAIVRYQYAVFNSAAYPAAMFAAAPTLPPCGQNTKASRTWVDVYDQLGKRLNGFCTFRTNRSLKAIWFSLEEGVVPPSWIYIEITDRQTGNKYRSNLAETTF